MRSAAAGLHADSIVVDLHADTLIQMRAVGYRFARRHRGSLVRRLGFAQTDLPRFREGGVTAQFFGLVTAPYPRRGCAKACFEQIEMLNREAAAHGLVRARTADDIRRAKREGRMAALTGIEGGHNIEGSLDTLRAFHEAGVRYLGLTHFTSNEIARPSGGLGADQEAPLTDFGREVVREMNRLGMIVDLAHVGRRAFLDACRLSTRPVIVSHTGLAGAYPLWRNIDDEQVRAVAETGGVMGVIFAWRYLGPRRGGIGMLAPHFERLRRVAGARHVALGGDFDGFVETPRGLEDVSRLPGVTAMLVEEGWSEPDIRAALGENVLRVLEAH